MANIIKEIEYSFKVNWDLFAITEPSLASSITYGELAATINDYHKFWKKCGLDDNEHIAICARNCKEWIELYLAIVTGGYVAIIIPDGLSVDDIIRIVVHSESRVLYHDKGLIPMDSLSKISNLDMAFEMRSRKSSYPSNNSTVDKEIIQICREDLNYESLALDNICTILYTSGSTGTPKGVMLSIKNLSFNIPIIPHGMLFCSGKTYLSLLPFSHIYGLLYDIVFPICSGMNIVLASKLTPHNVCLLATYYKPEAIYSVPSLLIQLIEYIIGDDLSSPENQSKTQDDVYCQYLKHKLINSLGGNLKVFMTGGAAIPEEIESLLVSKIQFPYISGYGMTECCGPLSIGDVCHYKIRSCGTIAFGHNIRVMNVEQGQNGYGEIQINDGSVFVGYYKDPSTTSLAFTEDGWFKTGDIGYIDENNNVYLIGRIKELLVLSNGEKVIPSAIESIINTMPYILESLLIQCGDKLHAIIVLNKEQVILDNLTEETLAQILYDNIHMVNKHLPGFVVINSYEISKGPLERTPKGNIKRFLYQSDICNI